MRILVIGNCQCEDLARLIRAMLDDAQVYLIRLLPRDMDRFEAGNLVLADLKAEDFDLGTLANTSDLILIQDNDNLSRQLVGNFPCAEPKVRKIPSIGFMGFHPDEVKIGNRLQSPVGAPHSSIVSWCWTQKLTVAATRDLFRAEVFEHLGFFDQWIASVNSEKKAFDSVGLNISHLIDRWSKAGIWMYCSGHPILSVLADIARMVLDREGIRYRPSVEIEVKDRQSNGVVWPVYPEIANRIGCTGSYLFKAANNHPSDSLRGQVFGLDEFICRSFSLNASFPDNSFSNRRLSSPRYQDLHRFLRESSRSTAKVINLKADEPASARAAGASPYQNLPDHQFWRRALERTPMNEVDPVVRSSFKLERSDKVATAGSCFAQHISRTLVKNGFYYYIPERADELDSEEAQRRNFGVFSARFGNLYTARQLLQLFDRAYGHFRPMEQSWTRSDGRLVDPFRPQIEPEGFATVEELEKSRAVHFAAVREMFETLDVFVFTLGLTEAWRSRTDGAVYPLAPGVVAGELNADEHEFVNFNAADVTADMQGFIGRLRSVNPQAKIILTVSPVPLIATYEDQHVLVSTIYSKSVLRVAAEDICQRNPMCAYFPSYEIITGNYTKSEYFESDLRSVTPQGVDHVMRLFMKHYGSQTSTGSLEDELMRENEAAAEVVCDEEAITVTRDRALSERG